MKSFHHTVTRGVVALLMATLALAGCGTRETSPSGQQQGQPTQPPAASARPYAGTTIRFLAANHPWLDTIKKYLPDFEKQTGITVQMESLPENNLTQKLTVELTSGGGSLDVFMQRPVTEAKLFEKNGWYADLNTFANDAKKTPSDYDAKDFFPGALKVETQNGHLVGLPLITEQPVLYYRKDLFAAKNIKVPTNMAELEAAAKALHDPANMVGIVMRGSGNSAVSQFAAFLYAEGGDFIKDGKFAMDAPEAVKALQIYGNLLGKYGPPGILNMSWPQAAGLFAQGKAAMWLDANSLFLNVTDPSKSTVGDKVGFAPLPNGAAGFQPYSVAAWGLAMASSSQHKDAAWEFMKWATSKEMVLKTQEAGNPGARDSVWNNPQGTKAWPAEWVEVARKSGAVGKPTYVPPVIAVGQARDLVGEIITAAITGKDVAATARDRNQKLNDLLAAESK